ncbi:hypothetical protein JST97_15915 [bacterium]|nr:hypothetical protein [bacterium]
MAFGVIANSFPFNPPSRPTGSADTIEAKINQRKHSAAPTGSADSIERNQAARRQQNQILLQQMVEAMERRLHPLQPAHGPR